MFTFLLSLWILQRCCQLLEPR